jgi:hypothetical protein
MFCSTYDCEFVPTHGTTSVVVPYSASPNL